MRKNAIIILAALMVTLNCYSQLPSTPVSPRKPVVVRSTTLPAASEEEITITPADIGPFCPNTLVAGDREFSGHGPKVYIDVTLVNVKKYALAVNITFSAKETQDNWSEVKGNWSVIIYRPPAGKQIAGILSGSSSGIHGFVCPAAEGTPFDCDGPVLTPHVDGAGPVKEIKIVGDTSGDDISTDTDCKCDTRIVKISFLPIKIKLMPATGH